MCLHTILLDPTNPDRMYIAISAAGAFRTDDGGTTWKPINKGLKSNYIPEPSRPRSATASTISPCTRRARTRVFMQKHWDVMRTDNCGDLWHEVSGNLPTDFGFPIGVHAHEPETIYVVPIKSDCEHFPPDGKLRVYRSRTGGNEWEALTNGLPQEDCYVNVLRDSMAVDKLDSCGIYFGTTGGQVYASNDSGDTWNAIVRDLPVGRLGRGPDAEMIRVVLPPNLKIMARVDRELTFSIDGPVTQRAVLDAVEAEYPMLRGTIRDQVTQQRRAFIRFFACEQDLSHESPDAPLPDPVVSGKEPYLIVGAIAGG